MILPEKHLWESNPYSEFPGDLGKIGVKGKSWRKLENLRRLSGAVLR